MISSICVGFGWHSELKLPPRVKTRWYMVMIRFIAQSDGRSISWACRPTSLITFKKSDFLGANFPWDSSPWTVWRRAILKIIGAHDGDAIEWPAYALVASHVPFSDIKLSYYRDRWWRSVLSDLGLANNQHLYCKHLKASSNRDFRPCPSNWCRW